MSELQKPLGSRFGARTTAADVLRGRSLAGVRAVITGGASGIGLETAKALSDAGAEVIVAARNLRTAEDAFRDVDRIAIDPLDLADPRSVRAFAERRRVDGKPIDILINNAGFMARPLTRIAAGYEAHFAVNHLAHMALTLELCPLLRPGARVVTVSSAGHHLSPLRWPDIHFQNAYDKWLAYAQSKTANILFTVHFDEIAKHDGIRAFAVHPGKIFTPLQRHLTTVEMIAAGWLTADGAPADPTFKTPAGGAATSVWAATAPELSNLGGAYCEDCDVARLAADKSTDLVGVKPYAVDRSEAARLWDASARMIEEWKAIEEGDQPAVGSA